MTSIEAYKKFELKVNKLSTNDNVDISPGEFVLVYNEQQIKWFEDMFRDRGTRYVDAVQKLISHDQELILDKDNSNHTDFKLPDNYFDYINSYSLADNGVCKDRVIYNEEIKIVNKNILYKDEYNTPSFDYQEGFITLAGNMLQVYKNNFNITKTFLTYYRYPVNIDIEGYIKINGSASITVDPELSDHYVDEVIDYCVREVTKDYADVEGWQLANTTVKDNDTLN